MTSSQKCTEASTVKSKEKRKIYFLKVYLPSNTMSDIHILKDLMEFSAFLKLTNSGRSAVVGFKDFGDHLKMIRHLLFKDYDGHTLVMKSFPIGYNHLIKQLSLPKTFTDQEAIKSHFGASHVQSKASVGVGRLAYMKHILTFPTYESANKADSMSFRVGRKLYFLKKKSKDIPKPTRNFLMNMAKKRKASRKKLPGMGKKPGLQKKKQPVKKDVKKQQVKKDVKKSQVKKDVKKPQVKKDVKKQVKAVKKQEVK